MTVLTILVDGMLHMANPLGDLFKGVLKAPGELAGGIGDFASENPEQLALLALLAAGGAGVLPGLGGAAGAGSAAGGADFGGGILDGDFAGD